MILKFPKTDDTLQRIADFRRAMLQIAPTIVYGEYDNAVTFEPRSGQSSGGKVRVDFGADDVTVTSTPYISAASVMPTMLAVCLAVSGVPSALIAALKENGISNV